MFPKNLFVNSRAKVLLLLFIFCIGWSLTFAAPAKAQLFTNELTSVPQTTSWINDAWVYIRNKMATIFFQNTLRKVLNDFAKNSAIYLGSGGKGQQALFIKEKYTNFWKNVGDAATGDFIQSFANSVVSDVAYQSNIKDNAAKKVACQAALDACVWTDEASYNKCLADNKSCLAVISDKNGDLKLCNDKYQACAQKCGTAGLAAGQDGPAAPADNATCMRSCDSINLACYNGVGGPTEQARKNAMLSPANRTGSPLATLNVCNPSLSATLGIAFGLGLTATETAWQPNCTYTTMVKNWQTEYDRLKSMSSKDFLKNFSSYFNPLSSDLSVAFRLNSDIKPYAATNRANAEKETILNGGWLDVRNLAGDLVGTKGEAQARKNLTDQALYDNLGKVTTDIIVDAANIFMNQYLITGWQTLTGSLSDTTSQTNLASYYNSSSPGRAAIEAKISTLTEPVFAEGAVNVLSNLSACLDESNPGPTDCVIPDGFSQAIAGKMTVIDAVKQGLLPGAWPFGFNKFGEDKLSYTQGYPFRSILILRKYRVLPIGWELAAQDIQRQYIQKLTGDDLVTKKPDGVSLNDLLACYDQNDDLPGYYAEWCRGLVDPYWVLKLPDYYCKAKGFGPVIQGEISQTPSGVKYCSTDSGKTMAKVDGEQKECTADNDCCSEPEMLQKDKLTKNNDLAGLRKFVCTAKCGYTANKVNLSRDNSYCADEQQCIKTDANGKCLYYGYCTAERRKWTFSRTGQDQTCDPYANTCTAYRDTSNTAHYYLANTLDFAQCDDSNVGCRKYALGGVWTPDANTVAWDGSKAVHLNAKAATCTNADESCHQFVRLQPSMGSNLIGDGDLEANDGAHWKSSGVLANVAAGDHVFAGNLSLHVAPGGRGLYYDSADQSLVVPGFAFQTDQSYTLSAMVYTAAGQVEMGLGNKSDPSSLQTVGTGVPGSWEQYVISIDNSFDVNADYFYLKGVDATSDFYVDNIQLTIGTSQNFTPYGSTGLAYLKVIPSYMEQLCYVNPPSDYTLKGDAPSACQNFVRRCNKEEAGCELYVDKITNDQIAAKTKPKDACPGACVGFDTFVQQANNFYAAREEHFIPSTARTCGANSVGCASFTNLDKLKQGGENLEYYSHLRNCIKPSTSQCAAFQVWEGSSDSGYQIRTYNMQANVQTATSLSQPVTVNDADQNDNIDGNSCNEYVYGLAPENPAYNPDCTQFIGKDGRLSYHNFSNTVSCTDTCNPYRINTPNVDPALDNSGSCASAGGHWDTTNLNCVVCYGGGVWNDEQAGCVYQGSPSESSTCAQSEVGCSEYAGNFGNSIKVIFNDSFENGVGAWTPAQSATEQGATVSKEALTQGGHSVHTVSNYLEKYVAGKIAVGKKYELTFMAKTKLQADGIAAIYFLTSTNGSNPDITFASQLQLTGDWRQYKFAINSVNNADIAKLHFSFSPNDASNIYLDNIKLTEVDDHYYLVRGSWLTPDSCNQDFRGNPFPLFMLGCRAYTDRSGATVSFKSFSGLCQLSGVGCEMMIDTNNSSDYRKQVFNDGVDWINSIDPKGKATSTLTKKDGSCDPLTEPSCLEVPADKISYVVYDSKKSCFQQKKGCQRLGMASADNTSYDDAYKVNDPDLYISQLCKNQDVGCAAWQLDAGGQVYFKDPGNNVCEYRQIGQTYGWIKKKTSYCFSGNACTKDSDCTAVKGTGFCRTMDDGNKYCASANSCSGSCGINLACKLQFQDEIADQAACKPTTLKTVGLGLAGEKMQPLGMFPAVYRNPSTGLDELASGPAGACVQKQAGCTEYIDPESRTSFNLLLNSTNSSVKIKPDVLYITAVGSGNAQPVEVNCPSSNDGKDAIITDLRGNTIIPRLAILDSGNNLTLQTSPKFSIPLGTAGLGQEFMIDSLATGGTSAIKDVNCTVTGNAQIKEAMVAYRLKQSIDRETPTKVDFVKGAVLFNERSYTGSKINSLTWQTAATTADGQPTAMITPDPPGNNANKLMQVDADRECSEWLGCKSYGINPINGKDKMCFERGLCNQLNDTGECISFLPADAKAQTYDLADANAKGQWLQQISNMTGYVKAGAKNNLESSDLYPLAVMMEQGDTKVPFDGTFEQSFDTGFQGYNPSDKTLNKSYAPIIRDAAMMQSELGISSYMQTPDGQTIGKGSGFIVKDVVNASGSDYIVSAYVFLRSGGKAELTVGATSGFTSCPILSARGGGVICVAGDNYASVASTEVTGQWVRLVGRFSIDDNYKINVGGNNVRSNVLRIGLKTDGFIYFDQILLEPGLQTTQSKYLAPSCRLFPQRDSLSCDYFDAGGIRRKGLTGYCLETDPRNSNICLMWYPLDKVASEDFEEGAGLNIPDDLYYCAYAEDQCRVNESTGAAVEPEFACTTFLKVDKTKYWYDRINSGSGSYTMSRSLLRNDSSPLFIDMGIDTSIKAGGSTSIAISQDIANGFYGALVSKKPLTTQSMQTMALVGSANNKRPYPFLPYAGISNGSLSDYSANRAKGLCKATVTQDGIDKPYVFTNASDERGTQDQDYQTTQKYDDCFIKAEMNWYNAPLSTKKCTESGQDKCCTWDAANNRCEQYADYNGAWICAPGNNQAPCATYSCAESSGQTSCTDRNGYVTSFNDVFHPPYYNFTTRRWDIYRYLRSSFLLGPVNLRCEAFKKDDGVHKFRVTLPDRTFPDVIYSGTCLFDCYYHVKNFTMGQTQQQSFAAVNHLFVGVDQGDASSLGCYTWDAVSLSYVPCNQVAGNTYTQQVSANFANYDSTLSSKTLNECVGNELKDGQRDPKVDDVCYINPVVSDMTSNIKEVHKSGWVQIGFNSQVDRQQLPLRMYTVNWGDGGSMVRTTNMFDRRPGKNAPQHVVLHYYDFNTVDAYTRLSGRIPCGKNNDGILASIKVTVVDNWDKSNQVGDPTYSICIFQN